MPSVRFFYGNRDKLYTAVFEDGTPSANDSMVAELPLTPKWEKVLEVPIHRTMVTVVFHFTMVAAAPKVREYMGSIMKASFGEDLRALLWRVVNLAADTRKNRPGGGTDPQLPVLPGA
jgi:hypothetical protein